MAIAKTILKTGKTAKEIVCILMQERNMYKSSSVNQVISEIKNSIERTPAIREQKAPFKEGLDGDVFDLLMRLEAEWKNNNLTDK